MSSQSALITGGAGFIGSHLCKALLDRGYAVTVLDDLSMGKRENIPQEANFVKGNILDEKLVNQTLKKYEICKVFHLAARVTIRGSISQFADDARNNLMGTVSLLSACEDTGVNKIVFASSMAVYADSLSPQPVGEDYLLEPLSPYGIAKLASEKYCLLLSEKMGVSCTVLRYFNTYGAGQQFTPYVGVITIFIEKLIEGSPICIFGDGNQSRDFIHVNDVVRATIRSAEQSESAGQILNVGTGSATTVNEIADLLCSKLNPKARVEYMAAHPGELKNCIADISRAREVIGFSPSFLLEDHLDEIIEYKKRRV